MTVDVPATEWPGTRQAVAGTGPGMTFEEITDTVPATDGQDIGETLAGTGWRSEVQIKPKRHLIYFTWRKGRGQKRSSSYGGKATYLSSERKSEYQQRTGRDIDAVAAVSAGRAQPPAAGS